MGHFLIIALCIVSSVIYSHSAPLTTEYGVPNKPFETYGPPQEESVVIEDASHKIPESGGLIRAPETTVDEAVIPEVHAPVVQIKGAPVVPIHKTDDRNQYAVGFDTPDGTAIREEGRLISTDDGWEYVIAKTGSYKYTSPEGKLIEVEWEADEKGFRIISTTA